MIGSSLIEYLILKDLLHSHSLLSTLNSLFFGNRWRENVLNISIDLIKGVRNFIIYMLVNFPTPNILLGLGGIIWGFKLRNNLIKSLLPPLFVLFMINFLFAFRYNVKDQYVFFIIDYLIFCNFISLGMEYF